MAVSLVVVKEQGDETRVAATPETVKKLIALGFSLTVEAGAGEASGFSDARYEDEGATIANSVASAIAKADVVVGVKAPSEATVKAMKKGALLIAQLNPYQDASGVKSYAAQGVDAMAMELMPRITRAQSMDVLSSQSNLSGYKAVLDATAEYNRALPMMMTAAGTVPAARVFVMGAGVAGLQAIATAKRLGAIVSATDVRRAAAEQVQSLGGTFVMVEADEEDSGETAGGYAKEMSPAYREKQAALIAETIPKQDIVICTALIPGRPAPVLVSADMVKAMKPGSVIVDLAVEQGGNCPLSKLGEVVEEHGVMIIGHANMPSRVAIDASALYAKNLLNFVSPLIAEGGTSLSADMEDEIVKGTLVTNAGEIVHDSVLAIPESASKPKRAAAKAAAD